MSDNASEISGLIRISDITPKEVSWLWQPYIPQGKITLLRGDGGQGKTTFCLTLLAAIISRGGSLPCSDGNDKLNVAAGNVSFISAEDDLADTIAPRLINAGADINKIYSYLDFGDENLTFSSELFEELVAQSQPALIIVDPIQAFFGAVDMNRANHVRPIMAKLRTLAEKYNCAILLVEHLTKSNRRQAFHRGLGSMDITSAARSVLMLGNDPNNPEERGLYQIKNNLCRLGDIVGFAIDDKGIRWKLDTYLTPDIIESRPSRKSGRQDASALEEAEDFLLSALRGGRQLCADVEAEALSYGISKRT